MSEITIFKSRLESFAVAVKDDMKNNLGQVLNSSDFQEKVRKVITQCLTNDQRIQGPFKEAAMVLGLCSLPGSFQGLWEKGVLTSGKQASKAVGFVAQVIDCATSLDTWQLISIEKIGKCISSISVFSFSIGSNVLKGGVIDNLMFVRNGLSFVSSSISLGSGLRDKVVVYEGEKNSAITRQSVRKIVAVTGDVLKVSVLAITLISSLNRDVSGYQLIQSRYCVLTVNMLKNSLSCLSALASVVKSINDIATREEEAKCKNGQNKKTEVLEGSNPSVESLKTVVPQEEQVAKTEVAKEEQVVELKSSIEESVVVEEGQVVELDSSSEESGEGSVKESVEIIPIESDLSNPEVKKEDNKLSDVVNQ